MIFLIFLEGAFASTCKRPYSNNITKIELSKCPQLKSFIENYESSNLYLVIASPFLKNPASLFGHNFLLFSKDATQDSINGVTLNFEAVDDSKNGLDYIYRGLFGKFSGQYNLKHFYNNIKIYNNLEDRDLTLYQLKYNKQEIYTYLLKAWEYSQNKSEINYFFLNGNCAFYITDFLKNKSPSSNLHDIYYSPQDTILDLQDKAEIPIVRASIKSLVKSYASRKEHISKLYAEAQFQTYQAHRGQKSNELKESLLALNKYKLKTKENIPEINSRIKSDIKLPYGKISLGSSGAKRWSLNGAVVRNLYVTNLGSNKLELLSFKTNDFNRRESEFILLDMESNQDFENKFKDISWDLALKHQNKDSLSFTSTNVDFGIGLSKKLLKSILASIKFNSIIDSQFFDLYPSFNLLMMLNNWQFNLELSQKYRTQYLYSSVSRKITSKTQVALKFEDFKDRESRTFMALDLSL